MILEEKLALTAELKELARLKLNSLNTELSDEEIEEKIEEIVLQKHTDIYISPIEKREIVENIFNSIRRLDVLQPLIDDKSITEIMVNGPDNIFIERDGKVSKLETRFESSEKLENVIRNIVSAVDRTVNEAVPIVDARLQDGSRINVVMSPIALNGPIITIRKFPEKPFTVDQLVKLGSLTDETARLLENMVKAKYNIFISGGTGSGKTTFLNALSNFIPKDERIITIEDSAELQIKGVENIVRMETRNANTEGKGAITIRELIKTSLRMRPERIIVGEVRGGEALDMLQAMNTGHDGSLSTGHANSAADMLSRLETMVLTGAEIPLEAIRKQIASAIDIIVHLSRLRDKSRRTVEISEVSGYKDGEIILNPIYVFEEEKELEDGRICGCLKRTKNSMIHMEKFRLAGLNQEV
ncbi:CpaF family protein [Pseudobacteroides cellulosolvens]|uniref:Type II secretion system protein E n=1 Tax=Pseudobacteroides cellulosolvens ATCC 35603 = DSM 2933 TaxID=398512 RepID=A0A0L6JH75_9FIRM|nr:CpaF family protein [Pseudobacteroides cellulosolvens]KNY25065.1 type II secretion system protein E [Pseudobacteroides cellulosolvens ATCC 35603 = DSM 2933]